MPSYRYKAVTATGEIVEGDMEASSRAAVSERLQELGHMPIRAEEVTSTGAQSLLSRDLLGDRPVSRKAIVLLTRELATLLGAGLPLEQALEILIKLSERKNVRKLLGQILNAVRGGASLADAVATHERVFPSYYASLIRAGEAGGALETVLGRLADFLERAQAIQEGIRSALIYPSILLFMAGLSVVVLLTVVVPEFKPLFEDAGDALPLSTVILIEVGEAFERYWWVMVLIVTAAAWILRRRLRNPAFRFRWDTMVLGLPLFGNLARKIQVARFSRTLGTLLQNGVTLLNALSIVRDAVNNAVLAGAIEEVAGRLKEGQGLADPLIATKVFPDLATQLVRVGEETGQLDSMLIKVADIYDREVALTTDRLLALLVPLLTISLGLLIAGIIASVLTAFLSVNQLAL